MKKHLSAIMLCLVFGLLISCGPAQQNRNEKSVQKVVSADQTTNEMTVSENPSASGNIASSSPLEAISSSASVEIGSDTSRKFIRTAELRFRVKDVVKTTFKIEDIIKLNGGFVSSSNLSSLIDYEENKSLTADSTLIITHFTINNAMTLRVPNTELDTTLKQIAPLVEFLDYRNIKATDVALDILSNRLTQIRAKKHDIRLSNVIDNTKSKVADATSAAESILNSQERSDQALISNLTLKDQIKYSTISIQLYQRPSVKYSIVVNEKNFRPYEPGFWKKSVEALQTGFDIFKMFILFLLKIWWLILLVLIAYIVYPKIRKRKAK